MFMLFLGAAALVLLAISRVFRWVCGVGVTLAAAYVVWGLADGAPYNQPEPQHVASAKECAAIRANGGSPDDVFINLVFAHCPT